MNWIKSNPFVAGLAGITVLLCGALYFLASTWATRHEEAKQGFEEAFQAVSTAERIPLYPTREHVAGKTKALTDHRQAIDNFRGLFSAYRPAALENVSPQAFTDRLKIAQQEVSDAFGKAEAELPENFYLGFEGYRNTLAQSGATGTLLYQLDGLKQALLKLAEARPSSLIKVHREAVVEENGGNYQPGPNDVVRYFPIEFAFRGSESSVREFITALGSTESHYFIIRCLKIQNERNTPPKVEDAKFEVAAAADKAAAATANPFGDAFFGGIDDDSPVEIPAAEGAGDNIPEITSEEPTEAAVDVDTTRILAQVLGNEELTVFVRFDHAMFLVAKELPKP